MTKDKQHYPISHCETDGHCACYHGDTDGSNAHAHLNGETNRCCFCGTRKGGELAYWRKAVGV